MTTAVYILFWTSLGILFYCYAGYGILVGMLTGIRQLFKPGKPAVPAPGIIPVTLVVTAYNEGAILEKKIQNSLSIDYPPGMLQLIVITDGSTDGSQKIGQRYPGILSLHQEERRGKYAAIKRAMRFVETPVVVFSDANSMLNPACVQRMAAHYADEKTGGVAGEKKITRQQGGSAVGEAEGLYWKYESFLKKLDAGFNTVTGAAGELFSIRTRLFRELDDGLILDDFVISMQICLDGYTLAYEPGAYALETPSVSLAEEEKRKVRISAGAYQSIGYLKGCLNIFRHPVLAFQYISRRLFRWILCPLMLLLVFFSNGYLVLQPGTSRFFAVIFLLQLLFYAAALTGWWLTRSGKRAWLFTVPFYFVFMNYCLVKGFIKFMRGRQTVLWEKSERQAAVP